MESVIIHTKEKSDAKLLQTIARRMGFTSRVISDEEKEEVGLLKAMEGGRKTKIVSCADIMKKLSSFFIFMMISLIPISCKDTGVQPIELQFSDIESMEYFRVEQPGTIVLRIPGEWDIFFDEHNQVVIPETIKVPPVDFNKQMVVGVFWGVGYSGCTNVSLSIEKVTLLSNKIEVTVGPVRFLGLCRAYVTPLHIVKIPRSDLPVVFVGNVPS